MNSSKIQEALRTAKARLESARREHAAGAYSKQQVVRLELEVVRLKNLLNPETK